jgi:hypothetical protein
MRGDPTVTQPGTININVPGTPVKAFLYWEGQMETAVNGDADLMVELNGGGAVPVNGTFIGGEPTKIAPIGDEWTTSFRADITGLAGWTSGANTVEVSGMDFNSRCPDCRNDGASVVVLYDDGSDAGYVGIKEGNDLAFRDFAPPYDSTVPQTFTFPMDDAMRTAVLYIIAGSVSYPDRPNVISVSFDGGPATDYPDLMGVAGGVGHDDWDTVAIPLMIPAGVTSVTVELKSEQGAGSIWPAESLPASMVWVTGALYVEPPEEDECEGCTPGFWKNHVGAWAGTPYEPTDDFDATFGVDYFDPDLTLCEALWNGGGGVNALGRHAVAALLNSAHGVVDYCLTDKDIEDAVENMDKGTLADFNEQYCPLGGPEMNGKCQTYGADNGQTQLKARGSK